jgi:hypothetical protein
MGGQFRLALLQHVHAERAALLQQAIGRMLRVDAQGQQQGIERNLHHQAAVKALRVSPRPRRPRKRLASGAETTRQWNWSCFFDPTQSRTTVSKHFAYHLKAAVREIAAAVSL